MTTKITTCPIWGTDYKAEGYFDEATRTFHIADSPRAGGGYVIPEMILNSSIRNLGPFIQGAVNYLADRPAFTG